MTLLWNDNDNVIVIVNVIVSWALDSCQSSSISTAAVAQRGAHTWWQASVRRGARTWSRAPYSNED